MNKIIGLVMFVLISAAVVSADGYFGFKAGTQWPATLRKMDGIGQKNAWSMGLEWGGFSQKKIGFGGSFCGVWKRFADDTLGGSFSDSSGGRIIRSSGTRSVTRAMFPLQFDLSVDPFPDLIVHPVLRCGGGPSAMIYTNRHRTDTLFDDEYTKTSGIYWGLIGRTGVDLMINLGKEARLILGAEYQWSVLSKRDWESNTVYRQDMSGPSVYLGIRIK